MAQSSRWHQGDVIEGELLRSLLQYLKTPMDGDIAVIASHDCDLHREGQFELIICTKLDRVDKQYISAKHPRILHLTLESESEHLLLELRQTEKLTLPFHPIEEQAPDKKEYSLSASEKRILKQWLAARYGRPAFPDMFEKRLRRKFNSKFNVERKVASILSTYSEFISAVFFEIPDECKNESPPDDLYILKIFIAIDSTKDLDASRKAVESAAQEIEEAFFKVYGEPGNSSDIELELCSAILETEITLTMIRRMDQWRVEYISLDKDEDSVVTSGAAVL